MKPSSMLTTPMTPPANENRICSNPVEIPKHILLSIINIVRIKKDRHTLLALSLTSRAAYEAGMPLLYNDIVIGKKSLGSLLTGLHTPGVAEAVVWNHPSQMGFGVRAKRYHGMDCEIKRDALQLLSVRTLR
jgi:hypothetical protein